MRIRLAAATGALLMAGGLSGVLSHASASPTGLRAAVHRLVPFGCNHPLSTTTASCFGYFLGDDSSGGPSGYGPADIQKAYDLSGVAVPPGTTVAVVDAYDDPKAESDLAVYRSQFGLPPCTSSNGCFRKLNEAGAQGNYPQTNTAWGQEISTDVDAVSATCPQCHIVVVEAATQTAPDFDHAMDVAFSIGAQAISNSYGFAERRAQLAQDDPHYNHPGVTASTGDSGYGVAFPSTSSHVTAVGGTTLTADQSPRGFNETAWSGSGSGCSGFEPKPTWQKDACPHRNVADVSADADPNTGIAMYDTFVSTNVFPIGLNPPPNGWAVVGGTSLSSPIVATIYAIAHNHADASYPYAHSGALYDVTSGSNCSPSLLGGSCPSNYEDTSGPGYDGPTGLGTPKGIAAF